MTHTFMSSRVREFGTTIFSAISALAREHNAVNLGQGFPDFDGPAELIEAARQALGEERNQYAVSQGENILRSAVAEHAKRFYGQETDPATEVTITSGATEALFCSAFAFLDPGDEVIVFEPFYDSYVPAIRLAGAVPVAVTLHAPDFRFDPDELRAAFSPKTKAIYINTPHNPTGTVFTRSELDFIAGLCIEHDVLAVTDEVYEHLVYDTAEHVRLATLPGMAERTLAISSLGKSFSLTGWKIGWAVGHPDLQTALRRVHQFSVFATTTPLQYAAAHALHMPDSYFTALRQEYRERRNYLVQVLLGAGLRPHRPQGSYFILADISDYEFGDGAEFCRFLIEDIGVAAIPTGSFYLHPGRGGKLVRFTFCKRMDTLRAAAERLEKLPAHL